MAVFPKQLMDSSVLQYHFIVVFCFFCFVVVSMSLEVVLLLGSIVWKCMQVNYLLKSTTVHQCRPRNLKKIITY